jgi:small subunit ribosomal protein S14
MAKKSMIAREVKRKKLVQKYAAKRKSLLDEFNAAKDPMERLEIHKDTGSA